MYKTPDFVSAIEFVVTSLDLFEDKDRKRLLSESRSFRQKQVYFKEFIAAFGRILELSNDERKYICKILLKIENVLSNLKFTSIYSDKDQRYCEEVFLELFTVPFLIEASRFIGDRCNNQYFNSFHEILTATSSNGLSRKGNITALKSCVNQEIDSWGVNADIYSELKASISKLDNRSFTKVSKINELLNKIQLNLDIVDQQSCSKRVLKIRSLLLSSRLAYYLCKNDEINLFELNDSDMDMQNCFLDFSNSYVLNDNISELDDSYLNDNNYQKCKNYFLCRIGQEDPAKYLKENGTRALWTYKDGLFLYYCIKEQFYWEINKGSITEKFLKGTFNFIKDIQKKPDRQGGEDVVDIAILYIAQKVLTAKTITPNSLEPAISLLIENISKHSLIRFVTLTPFGEFMPEQETVTQTNIAMAVRLFNERVKDNIINSKICNPMLSLDSLLKSYFIKGVLNKNERINSKPIKTDKTTLYDALRNIDYHLVNFGLEKKVCFDQHRQVVESSYAGENIDRFLSLSHQERRAILEFISPEEYAEDVKKYPDFNFVLSSAESVA